MKIIEKYVVDLPPLADDVKESELKSDQDKKKCLNCNLEKAFEDFYKEGRDNHCKQCRKDARKQRYRNADKPPLQNEDAPSRNAKSDSLLQLSKEEIVCIAEVFLILELWQAEAQRELSNSKSVPLEIEEC